MLTALFKRCSQTVKDRWKPPSNKNIAALIARLSYDLPFVEEFSKVVHIVLCSSIHVLPRKWAMWHLLTNQLAEETQGHHVIYRCMFTCQTTYLMTLLTMIDWFSIDHWSPPPDSLLHWDIFKAWFKWFMRRWEDGDVLLMDYIYTSTCQLWVLIMNLNTAFCLSQWP